MKKAYPTQKVLETNAAVYIDGFRVDFVEDVHSKIIGNHMREITLKFIASDFEQDDEPLNDICGYQWGVRK